MTTRSTARPVDQERGRIRSTQDALLRELLRTLDGRNPFYTAKLKSAGLRGEDCDRQAFLERCPFTTKAELVADQQAHPPFGSNLTFALERYVRFCQTSGSTGTPIRWLDTEESWGWMLDNWRHFYRVCGVTPADRVFAAFSFGPFLGFWTAFEAAVRLGCLAMPGGGLSTRARLEAMHDIDATVLLATPTYVVRLGEAARQEGIPLPSLRRIFVAGEPGGSIPATRALIAQLWPGVQLIDHHGMTEVGPVSWQSPTDERFLHVLETSYLAEIIDPQTLAPVPPGQTGELVLTSLGRIGSPLLRYRTGDLVRAALEPLAEPHLALEGGIIGRVDDMVIVRGVNIWPTAVEAVIRRFPEVAEYRVVCTNERGMAELHVSVEAAPPATDANLAERVAEALRAALNLRIPVDLVAANSLPRPDMKSRRWVKG